MIHNLQYAPLSLVVCIMRAVKNRIRLVLLVINLFWSRINSVCFCMVYFKKPNFCMIKSHKIIIKRMYFLPNLNRKKQTITKYYKDGCKSHCNGYIAFALYFLITAAPDHPDWSDLVKWQARVANQWQPRYKAYRHVPVYSSDPG